MIAIVFPIHAWGPAIKVRVENVGLYDSGNESQRSGLNLVMLQGYYNQKMIEKLKRTPRHLLPKLLGMCSEQESMQR